MYEFVRGPLVWIAFIGFFGGLLYRFIMMAKLAKKDKVVYATFDAKYGLRSLLHWVIPFAGVNMRHAVLWQESWGIRWWSLPEGVADIMTLVVIFACIFFIIRRLVRPEVRNVSYPSDFLLALLVMAPFVTGYVAHQQWLPYKPMIIIHGLSGALWLLLIPWTRLVHMLWFPFTGERIRRGAPLEGLVMMHICDLHSMGEEQHG